MRIAKPSSTGVLLEFTPLNGGIHRELAVPEPAGKFSPEGISSWLSCHPVLEAARYSAVFPVVSASWLSASNHHSLGA